MSWHFLSAAINRHSVALASVVLLFFSLGIYSSALNHGFVWDDEGIIVKEQKIRDLSNIPSFFVTPLILGENDASENLDDGTVRYYRPLIASLHAIEYRLFGINPLGYKIINLLLNGAIVVCAFLLVRALTGETLLAFLATLLYAANPARGEVVYWVYSDSHLFAGLFFLLALLAYHRGRTVLALVAVAAGLLCQESVVLFPALLLVYHFTIVPKQDRNWQRVVPFFVLVAIYLVIRQQITGALPFADLALMDRFRAIAYLSVKHLQVFFITDAPVTMYRYLPGMFSEGGVVTAVTYLFSGMLFALGTCLVWFRRRWFFWFAWFFIFISLSFNVAGYVDYLMAEKSLYLAALGPCVLIAALVLRIRRHQWVGLMLLLALVGYQAWTTVARGQYWTDTVTYLEKLLEFEPGYDVAQYHLGVEFLSLKRYEDALHQFDVVQSLRPTMRQQIVELKADVNNLWGRSLAEQGDFDGALIALNNARKLSPARSSIYNGLGIVHFLREEQALAAENWEMALRLDPGNIEARSNLDMLLKKEK